jgi:hypothetical protein
MVKKHPRNVAKILTVYILKSSINFKESNLRSIFPFGTPVYFVSWWMSDFAFFRMLTKLLLFNEETETEVTNIKTFTMVFFGQRSKVPGL